MAAQKREVIANSLKTAARPITPSKPFKIQVIAPQQIMIDDHVEPYIQVAAMGTTVGGEAGSAGGRFLRRRSRSDCRGNCLGMDHRPYTVSTFEQLASSGLPLLVPWLVPWPRRESVTLNPPDK